MEISKVKILEKLTKFKWKCPDCGFTHIEWLEGDNPEGYIRKCDNCGEYFRMRI